MLEYYEKLLALKCFSHKDAMRLFGDARRTTNILYAMKKKGLIQSVRRDFYAVVSLETKEPVADAFEIASRITENSCISHRSAFEYYGAAERVLPHIWVSSESSFREFQFNGCQYHCITAPNGFGISVQGTIRVTDRERTVLDGIKDMDRVGGLAGLIYCLGRMSGIREDVLTEYLEKYQNQFMYQKAGYLLRYFPQLGLTEAFFNHCRRNKGQSSRYLGCAPGEKGCTFLGEWGVCIPDELRRVLEKEGEKVVI